MWSPVLRTSLALDGAILAALSFCVLCGWLGLGSAVAFAGGALGVGLMVAGVWPARARDWPNSLLLFGLLTMALGAAVFLLPNQLVNAGSGQDGVTIASTVGGIIVAGSGFLILLIGLVARLSFAPEEPGERPPE